MSTTTTTQPGRRTAIQIDARSEATLDSITAADFLEALGNDAIPTLAQIWPEKKKVELHSEPEVSPNLKLGVLLDRINEKKKVELFTQPGNVIYPPYHAAAPGATLYSGGSVGFGRATGYGPLTEKSPRTETFHTVKRDYMEPQVPVLVKGPPEPWPDPREALVLPPDIVAFANQISERVIAQVAPRIEAGLAASLRSSPVGR